MTKTPSYYQRRARRRLMRLAFYWIVGGIAGVLTYSVVALYVALFV